METPCWVITIKQKDEAWCINGRIENGEATYEVVQIFKGGGATVVGLSIEIWAMTSRIGAKNPDETRLVDVNRRTNRTRLQDSPIGKRQRRVNRQFT